MPESGTAQVTANGRHCVAPACPAPSSFISPLTAPSVCPAQPSQSPLTRQPPSPSRLLCASDPGEGCPLGVQPTQVSSAASRARSGEEKRRRALRRRLTGYSRQHPWSPQRPSRIRVLQHHARHGILRRREARTSCERLVRRMVRWPPSLYHETDFESRSSLPRLLLTVRPSPGRDPQNCRIGGKRRAISLLEASPARRRGCDGLRIETRPLVPALYPLVSARRRVAEAAASINS